MREDGEPPKSHRTNRRKAKRQGHEIKFASRPAPAACQKWTRGSQESAASDIDPDLRDISSGVAQRNGKAAEHSRIRRDARHHAR